MIQNPYLLHKHKNSECVGILVCRDIRFIGVGILGCRNSGLSEYWGVGILGAPLEMILFLEVRGNTLIFQIIQLCGSYIKC